MPFLPTEKQDAPFDFIMITVDAYVDHSSFGHAIISRLIEAEGFFVGILPQPVTAADYAKLGEPNIAFLVSGGVVDSMVCNYTVAKQRRTENAYCEGGRVGKIPDRAVTKHTQFIKKLFPQSFVIIGGIEASLRRFAHYDYWSDTVMPSILVSSGADMLSFGMGENTFWEMLARLKGGEDIRDIKGVCGTGYVLDKPDCEEYFEMALRQEAVFLPSYESVCENKAEYVKAFRLLESNSEFFTAKPLLQRTAGKYVVMNKPSKPLTTEQMDKIYAYPYMRSYHYMYKDGVPALGEVKFSLTSHRGCFGNCSYCAITINQGRLISNRSHESIIEEAEMLTKDKDFKGYIHDVGGPSANFRNPQCDKANVVGTCKGKQCIGYEPCKNLKADHSDYMALLRELRALDGVKKVFVRSGVRYDYIMYDTKGRSVLNELCEHHISGLLKVAPEHCAEGVLKRMNKPSFSLYRDFCALYSELNEKQGKEQYLVPYLISSLPGCTLSDAVSLARYLKSINYMPLQVQDFYPTPSTRATTEYYTELDVDTLKPIFVSKNGEDKRAQRALMQYRNPQNFDIIRKALISTDNKSLIGTQSQCLVPPSSKPASSGKPTAGRRNARPKK